MYFRLRKISGWRKKHRKPQTGSYSDAFQAEKDFLLEEKASEMTNRNFSDVFHGMMGIVKSGGPT